MRSILDILYGIGAVLGGICLVAILGLVVTQVVARWMGIAMAGIPEFSGYAMAATFFLPLAYTFRSGGHIRITILLDRSTGGGRWIFECLSLVVGFGLSAYFAVFMVRLTYISHLIRDVSQGADATPLWIPQLGLAAGSLLLAMAVGHSLFDHLFAPGRVAAEGVAE